MTTKKAIVDSTINIEDKQQTNDINLLTKSKIMTPADTAESFSSVSSFQQSDSTTIITYEDPNRTCTWLEYNGRLFSSTSSVPAISGNAKPVNPSDELKRCFELGKNNCNAVVLYNPGCWRCPSTYWGKIISDVTNSEPNSG